MHCSFFSGLNLTNVIAFPFNVKIINGLLNQLTYILRLRYPRPKYIKVCANAEI
jgi:hypothetical protein